MKRIVVLVAACAALALPAVAGAVNYYGYNYLSSTLPNDNCAPYQGRACSGYNYWSYSEVDKNSGGVIRVGYQPSGQGFDYWNDYGSDWNGYTPSVIVSGYSRAVCQYISGGSSYVRCRAE